jgi:NADH-quinone oxidoreductase subunit L
MEHFVHRLGLVFPPDDFALLLVIVGMPLVGALVNGLFGKRLGKEAVTLMALVGVGVSFLASVLAFFLLRAAHAGDAHGAAGEATSRFVWKGWTWLTLSARGDVDVPIQFALSIDALSATMALVITGIGFLIHLYSTKYMEGDPGYWRFFTYLNLFVFSMLVLVLGDNLPMLFIGWEGVGLCSYLLIGFWFQDAANAKAGKKAFITNRIGDFGLIVAMGFILFYVGALDWNGIDAGRARLVDVIQIWPLGSSVPLSGVLPASLAEWVNTPIRVSVATLVGLALFIGCAGKSAQLPLYVWLPDAMAGPTPVSALIHAATMVTAGVYLVCRMAGVFVLSPFAMFVIAFVGVLTALLAATIALVQTDIKKVLAYSTVSQLGYMFLGVGVGAFSAGFFHVLTHAFFKACLFLGAGSVIHAMHARIHDTVASQDMRNMGGMRRYMPTTYWTFLISVLAIAGFPLTSGFFSKDEILYKAWTNTIVPPTANGKLAGMGSEIELFTWPSWGPTFLFAAGVLGAVLTAFYMARLLFGIFWGEFKGWQVVPGMSAAAHGHDAHGHDGHDAHDAGKPLEGPEPHESPWAITLPLVVLAALALVGGFLNPHQLSVLGVHFAPLDHWLEPVFAGVNSLRGTELIVSTDHEHALVGATIAISVVAGLAGLGGAYWVYVMSKGAPAEQFVKAFPGLHKWALNKWYVDELYEETVLGAVDSLADMAVWFDRWVVDGIVAGVTSTVVAAAGGALRLFQTGRVQVYASAMVLGLAALSWFYVVPRASAKTLLDHGKGQYRISAAPGLGYSYRWDADGDGRWDDEAYGDQRDVQFNLEPKNQKTVKLEVKNAFGFTAERTFAVERPAEDRSRPTGDVIIERGADGKSRVRQTGSAPTRTGVIPAGGAL